MAGDLELIKHLGFNQALEARTLVNRVSFPRVPAVLRSRLKGADVSPRLCALDIRTKDTAAAVWGSNWREQRPRSLQVGLIKATLFIAEDRIPYYSRLEGEAWSPAGVTPPP